MSRIGSLLEIANKLINAFTGPLFGIYLLAMFSRRATAVPVLIAGVLGSFTSYYVAYRTSDRVHVAVDVRSRGDADCRMGIRGGAANAPVGGGAEVDVAGSRSGNGFSRRHEGGEGHEAIFD